MQLMCSDCQGHLTDLDFLYHRSRLFLFTNAALTVLGSLHSASYLHRRTAQVLCHVDSTPFTMIHTTEYLPTYKVAISPPTAWAGICAVPSLL
jgi:hypothetical protein